MCYIDTKPKQHTGWLETILSLKCGHRLSHRIYLEPGDGTGVQASLTAVSTLPAKWPFAGGFNKKQVADCIYLLFHPVSLPVWQPLQRMFEGLPTQRNHVLLTWLSLTYMVGRHSNSLFEGPTMDRKIEWAYGSQVFPPHHR